jgi:hypothetical protein
MMAGSMPVQRGPTTRGDPPATWFAMLHADVEPEQWWIDKLIDEAELHDADFLSAVIPIKDERGMTSTAIERLGFASAFLRLTQKQIASPLFPRTFGIDECVRALTSLPPPLRVESAKSTTLLCNTGCMVCRLDRAWCDPTKVYFHIGNQMAVSNGRVQAVVMPEDWYFSWSIAKCGGKVMATKALNIIHHGSRAYSSRDIWGQDTDIVD